MYKREAFSMIECLVSITVLSFLFAAVSSGRVNMNSFLKKLRICNEEYIRAAETDKKIRFIADRISIPFWVKDINVECHENILSVEYFLGTKEKTDFVFDERISFLSAEIEEENGHKIFKTEFSSGKRMFKTFVAVRQTD